MEMVETARHGLPVRTARQERNARYYQSNKKRLNASETSESVLNKTLQDDMVPSPPPPKITNQTPSTPSSKTTARAKRRTALAEDAQPSAVDGREALAAGLSAEEFRSEWRGFRDFHRSKGNTMADWPAAWRTWLRNRKRFAPSRASPANRRPTLAERFAQFDHDEPDQPHEQPSHNGPTIDGQLATSGDDRIRAVADDPLHECVGADAGWPLAATGYSRGFG